MSEEVQLNQEQIRARKPQAEFQEAPGETEADATREAFLNAAGADPAGQAAALASADGPTRAHALHRLQRQRGNSYVQRVVARARVAREAHGAPGRLVGASQPEMVDEVQQRKGGGSPLPEGTRQEMEGFFGADLGNVRVHADGEANDLNRELSARAFTVGSDVFFSGGQYDPGSREGQGLLAHELTHVGQQGGFGAPAAPAAQRAAAAEEEEQVQREAAPEEEEQVQRQAAPEEEEQAGGG